jgi:CxxC motif-containing protein (DUF1111 family)
MPAPEKLVPAPIVADLGRELFLREWLPHDPRSRGGDGLGPMFNDSSCVACHNLGGPGGGGPAGKNVDILSAADTAQAGMMGARSPDRAELTQIHPGLRASTSVVLHRYGTAPSYETWRLGLLASLVPSATGSDDPRGLGPADLARREIELGRIPTGRPVPQVGARRRGSGRTSAIAITRSQRNTPALFGAGPIDAIPDAVIEAVASVAPEGFPGAQGRVSRLENGAIGRFGWKAQTTSLRDFVLTACAVELGLDVADHAQAGDPLDPERTASGPDMNPEECDALVAFVSALPTPVESRSADLGAAAPGDAGKELFMSIGCAACHRPKLGDVAGIYSDLLLHDMGSETADTGRYSPFRPRSPGLLAEAPEGARSPMGPTQREWRTPPLWGVRDSAPYLHDGRAETLEQAIALHGGQGEGAMQRFFGLTGQGRGQILAFLKSLAAPVGPATAPIADVVD